MRDASLDEFVDAGDDETGDGETGDDEEARGDDGESGGSDGVSGPATAGRPEGSDGDHGDGDDVATDAVELATVTYEWAPDGGACASCESVVEVRWRDDEGLVCAECKRW